MQKPIVNILIVTDDGLSNGGFRQWAEQALPDRHDSTKGWAFHLGEFISVLTKTSWLGFDVTLTKAHRTKPGGSVTEAQLKTDRGADVVGFRFGQPFQVDGVNKTLADYDMVLFFPVSSYSTEAAAELQGEAEAITQFMEKGGGFFATGDHEDLGAPLARLIPRVRSMRRWFYQDPGSNVPSSPGPNGEPPAPSGIYSDRHDTLRPGDNSIFEFEDQSDQFAQPIKPVWFGSRIGVAAGYAAVYRWPHPLLCSPDGVVAVLPDHMHEGWCEVPDDLGKTFKLGASTIAEYPAFAVSPSATGSPLPPNVVATADVIGGHTTPAIDQADHFDDEYPTDAQSFGVIAAWDGHRVDKGRVVVDSTWHHFFNINLTGDLFLENMLPPDNQRLHGFYVKDASNNRVPNDDYKMIQWYYRNIVYWLIPANRHVTIFWTMLNQMTALPRFAEELTGSRAERLLTHTVFRNDAAPTLRYTLNDLVQLVYFGQLAEAYLRKARGACSVAEIRIILYKPKIPWWEWVEEIADPWVPVQQRGERPGDRLARLGGLDLAPRLDVLLKAGLGAALLAAAQARRAMPDAADNPAALAHRLDRAWSMAFDALIEVYRREIRAGTGLVNELDRALAAPSRR